VTTQDWHIAPGKHWADEPDYIDTWPVHCAAESTGAELHDFIKEIEDKFVDEKFFKGQYAAAYSGFEAVNKDGVLLGPWLHQKADELGYEEINTTVVGLAYDYCVKATAIDAAHEKMNPQVVYSLTAPVHGDGWYSDHSKEMIREGVIIHAVNS
jgi:nicotinamidase/pyrazinamidase